MHFLVIGTTFVMITDDLEQLLKGIMNEARRLVNAERCSFFLLEKQHNSKVPRLVAKAFDGPDHLAVSSTTAALGSCVIPAEYRAIAGHVAVTGQLLNIADAYSHPLFCQEVDKATGFKTRFGLPLQERPQQILFPFSPQEHFVLPYQERGRYCPGGG